jgi:Domain of unknown function (DUF4234)
MINATLVSPEVGADPAIPSHGGLLATVVDIDGELYKQRSPTGAWLLTFVTLLVYWFVWYYKINDEARRYLRDHSIKPWVAVLAIFPGLLLLLVPLLISVYRTGQRIERIERQAGITKRIRPVWGSVFSFAAILAPLFSAPPCSTTSLISLPSGRPRRQPKPRHLTPEPPSGPRRLGETRGAAPWLRPEDGVETGDRVSA